MATTYDETTNGKEAHVNGAHPDSTSRQGSLDLAIVGGGLGGLCLAVALHDKNIPVHVYEAAPSFGEIGAGVGLGPNALRAMAMLDKSQRILKGYKKCETSNVSPEEQKRFFNFRYGMSEPLSCKRRANGETKASNGHLNGHANGETEDVWTGGRLIADVRSDDVTSSVHRARFLEELVKLMPEGSASFGKRLATVEEPEDERGGVVLQFEDGSSARHDAVIGCDGIKSQTRRILLGKGNPASEPVFTGKFCYRGLVPAEKAKAVLGDDLAVNSQMCMPSLSFSKRSSLLVLIC